MMTSPVLHEASVEEIFKELDKRFQHILIWGLRDNPPRSESSPATKKTWTCVIYEDVSDGIHGFTTALLLVIIVCNSLNIDVLYISSRYHSDSIRVSSRHPHTTGKQLCVSNEHVVVHATTPPRNPMAVSETWRSRLICSRRIARIWRSRKLNRLATVKSAST